MGVVTTPACNRTRVILHLPHTFQYVLDTFPFISYIKVFLKIFILSIISFGRSNTFPRMTFDKF